MLLALYALRTSRFGRFARRRRANRQGASMVDLTELEDGQPAAQRRVQVDGALVRGETETPDPEMLRALLRGLQQLDVDAPVQRQAHATS